jgi:hypothetical protein
MFGGPLLFFPQVSPYKLQKVPAETVRKNFMPEGNGITIQEIACLDQGRHTLSDKPRPLGAYSR